MIVKNMLEDKGGSIIVSVILGLGLAALFRRACQGDGCIVIKAPPAKEVRDSVYRLDTECYKYTPEVVPCPLKGRSSIVKEH